MSNQDCQGGAIDVDTASLTKLDFTKIVVVNLIASTHYAMIKPRTILYSATHCTMYAECVIDVVIELNITREPQL